MLIFFFFFVKVKCVARYFPFEDGRESLPVPFDVRERLQLTDVILEKNHSIDTIKHVCYCNLTG